MTPLANLKIKIYADGAARAGMLEMYRNPIIKGFTTNPTLMRKARVEDYEAFAHQVLGDIPDRPISFEVFSDELDSMESQGRRIASWGENVYVKIPVTNTRGESTTPVIRNLALAGVQLNVTAVFTLAQVNAVCRALGGRAPAVVSVFAGRIADAGVDPMPRMADALRVVRQFRDTELLWASPRELLNIIQADQIGCDIITVSNDLLGKLSSIGKDLDQFSLETVRMFYQDAVKAGYRLDPLPARRAA